MDGDPIHGYLLVGVIHGSRATYAALHVNGSDSLFSEVHALDFYCVLNELRSAGRLLGRSLSQVASFAANVNATYSASFEEGVTVA